MAGVDGGGFFWGDVNSDPKRRFRFEIGFGGTSGESFIPAWTIKTGMKPKANVSVVEHQYIDHVFKYPGRVTWDPITLTLVDPVNPDISFALINALGKSGYKYPNTPTAAKESLSKAKSNSAVGVVYIRQINSEGFIVEEWQLHNPFITQIDFGGSLDYSADEMNEVTIELQFDWAKMTKGNPGAVAANRPAPNITTLAGK
jgi:hypothetical protein